MLKRTKRSDSNSNSTASGNMKSDPSGSPSTIGFGTTIQGDFNSVNDIRIDGKLIGNIDCAGKLIIGPKAIVDGKVSCSNAIVEGKFIGTLKVKHFLEVLASADMSGEIVTDKLQVLSGAKFNVICSTGGKSIKSFTREVDEKGEVVSMVN